MVPGKSAPKTSAELKVSVVGLFPAICRFCIAVMVDVMELPKSRINASMVTQFIDQPVCFVGRLEKVRALAALGSPWGRTP